MERSRRNRTQDKRSEALAKLKRGGGIHDYEVDEVQNVYEEVDEGTYQEMRDQRASDFVVGADADDWMDDGRDVFDDDDEPFQEDAKTKKQKKKMAKFASGSGNIAAMILKQAKNSKTKTKAKDIKMHDDDDLDAIMNEIDDGNVSMKVTPRLKKSKKSKKPQAPAITFNSSPEKSSKKRVLQQRVQNPTKRPKLDKNVFKREAEAKQEYISDNDDELPEPGDVFGDNDFDEEMSEDENRIPKKEPSSTEISSKLQNISMEEEKSVINHVKEEPDSQIDWNATKTCVEFDKEEDIQYPVDENCLNLYWLDAYETQYNKSGKLYLTGRANVAGELKSCCLIISNIPHVVYILPRENSDTGDVYEEIGEWMDKNKVDSWKAKPMKKKNFFGGAGVPPEAEYLRVEYGPKNPLMSSTMKGAHFSHVFNVNQPLFEFFALERNIMGPCWLSISSYSPVSGGAISWCSVEYDCTDYRAVQVHPDSEKMHEPQLTMVSLSFKTIPLKKTNELAAFTLVVNKNFRLSSTKKVPEHDYIMTALSKPATMTLPYDWNGEMGGNNEKVESCLGEKHLLNIFLKELRQIDPDIILGHDLLDFGLEYILQRMKVHSVNGWSRLGRIKRKDMPRMAAQIGLARAGHDACNGRLVADTKTSAMELVKMRDYNLTSLCEEQIPEQLSGLKPHFLYACKNRKEYLPEHIVEAFGSSNTLRMLLQENINDCFRNMLISSNIQSLPLAVQITNICGNILSRTLSRGRAERNAYLLLHAFHKKDHLPPPPYKKKTVEDGDKKGPKFAGGMVLEPKKGLYTNYILLLDFNSLYPSIIQEYNICFTTTAMQAPPGEDISTWLPDLPKTMEEGILPFEIKKLVNRRKEVKKLIKNEKNADELARLNIRQLGLKLTANSMYGCLGFTASRFCAQPLAALVTAKGREILEATKVFVEKMNLEVVYGDTDSIMINSNSTNISEVMKLGNLVKKEVNKHYRLLEIDIDGAYKSMLLLKKKKYAAIDQNGKEEFKGLDIVRRDWSEIARNEGRTILKLLLHEQDEEEGVRKIHEHLEMIGTKLENKEYRTVDYRIQKALTKAPEQYPKSGDGQPHVKVALRMNKKQPGKFKAGDTVPYIICCGDEKLKAADRAFHPSEVAREKKEIDIDYYLRSQLVPVFGRLLDPIEATDEQQIATRLGMDPSAFKSRAATRARAEREEEMARIASQKEEEKLANCTPLEINIGEERLTLDLFVPPFSQNYGDGKALREKMSQIECALRKALKLQIKRVYDNWQICSCGYRTRFISPNYTSKGLFACPSCEDDILKCEFSISDFYLQLQFFQRIFDADAWLKKMNSEIPKEKEQREMALKEINRVNEDYAYYVGVKKIADEAMKRCNFGKVSLPSLWSSHFTTF
ncbi:unnamed protein product [Oikopleura dioica]|uniref:DNA polymerase n=1 Tax=Oikopleura dioica TaxID=34765 RepID=E4XQI4_OIKDI|nr:unnamed protein product [Oikopleura dioica]CBY33695.1 unnamed protein product [Oikopleura dioica]